MNCSYLEKILLAKCNVVYRKESRTTQFREKSSKCLSMQRQRHQNWCSYQVVTVCLGEVLPKLIPQRKVLELESKDGYFGKWKNECLFYMIIWFLFHGTLEVTSKRRLFWLWPNVQIKVWILHLKSLTFSIMKCRRTWLEDLKFWTPSMNLFYSPSVSLGFSAEVHISSIWTGLRAEVFNAGQSRKISTTMEHFSKTKKFQSLNKP